ncbi:MAG: NERD domain-containing protein [Spartobacteria bacterium]|nr:NERD domain-containing protein [Spartobacteria bacterium]
MAKTLTNERNLLQRREAIARDLSLLKRMRLVEWGAAALFIVAGLVWRFGLDKGFFVLFIGGVLAFLALGHEARRREQLEELADTETMRGAKEAVAKLLDDKLANDHYVLNDLRLKVGREKCWIDHLVVAPSGMFVINTMNWEGKIVGDTGKQAYTWKIRAPDGKIRPARNPVGRALRERRILCNWLKGTNLIWERVFPLVVLANPNADIQVTNAGTKVLTPEKAVTFINDFCFEKPVLSNAEVEKLAQGLNAHSGEA